MATFLKKIIKDNIEESRPTVCKELKEKGTFDAYLEELHDQISDEIHALSQRKLEALKKTDPRIDTDFEYRARTINWCMSAAREEVLYHL